jgi:hypothetical protein
MITEDGLQKFFAAQARILAARTRVQSPRFSRYHHHNIWHVCFHDQRLPFDDDRWIEVAWWQREVILRNEQADPHYAPYCLRCTGLVRMRKVAPHHWRCSCGAQCDYRVPAGQ